VSSISGDVSLSLYLFLSLPLNVQGRGPIVLVDPCQGPSTKVTMVNE
jgi:hypothetical protein